MDRFQTYQHLLARGMDPSLYRVSVDAGVVSFPLYDFSGVQVGYQEYRPFAERNCRNVREARYFTYLPKSINGYFGLETLKWSGTVYLVEGVFKAGKLHSLGVPSVAPMGSEVKRHRNQLSFLDRRLVGIGDNDDAGRKFAKQLDGFVSPTDLDEMENGEVRRLLDENS